MTMQAKEVLIYKGKKNFIDDTPLDSFEYRLPDKIEFGNGFISSACWRGYIGTWLIEDERLYLIDLEIGGDNSDDSEFMDEKVIYGLEDLFPGFEDGAFAHWFTGHLFVPLDNYEIDEDYRESGELELLTFVKGIHISSEIVSGRHLPTSFDHLAEDDEGRKILIFKKEFLVKRVDILEVEKINLISDPFSRVPSLPFGFLNSPWNSFLEHRNFADELWGAIIPKLVPYADGVKSTFDIEGYVFMKAGKPIAEFIK